MVCEVPEGLPQILVGLHVADGAEEAGDDVEAPAEVHRDHIGLDELRALDVLPRELEHLPVDVEANAGKVVPEVLEVVARPASDVQEVDSARCLMSLDYLLEDGRLLRIVLLGVDEIVVGGEAPVEYLTLQDPNCVGGCL